MTYDPTQFMFDERWRSRDEIAQASGKWRGYVTRIARMMERHGFVESRECDGRKEYRSRQISLFR